MTCIFCGSRSNEGEHRCRKCGRRPGDTLDGDFILARTEGALAAKYDAKYEMRERAATVEAVAPRPTVKGVQRSLFPERQSNLIQFSEFAPQKGATVKAKAPAKPRTANRRRGVSSNQTTNQTTLDFTTQPAAPRQLNTTVEAMVSCDLPVATAPHRALAAALDWSMALIGYGLFLAAYFAMGGEFTWDRVNLLVFAGALLLVGFTYGLTWALLGTDSAGMRWMGLRVITFDGFPLERGQRILRFAGSCLSFCTVLGQLWGLWDEESLTWQDHISETFPTPRGAHAQVFRRV